MGNFHGKVGTNNIYIHPDNCRKYGVVRMNGEGEATELQCNE